MKLFSFKKKKPANLEAREGKRQLRHREQADPRARMPERHEERETERGAPQTAPAPKHFGSASAVILHPRIAEKATDLSAKHNAYAFDVDPRATKQQIAAGVRELYGVSPKRVNVVHIPAKKVRGRRGESGVKAGGKKAYVYLNKGDSIEFV
jgi:large subunit ribosomal protein L23